MNDLALTVLDAVPAGSYALRGLVELVEIVESDTVPTAAIEGSMAPRMLINPSFIARHAATPERLLMLVMHELHHVILGHTRLVPVVTALDNVIFDAVINAMLCRAFPDPRGIAFLTSFYAADAVPAAILRPPDGWTADRTPPPSRPLVAAGHRRLAEVHRALYSPGGASYEELREAIADACPAMAAAATPLLGDHDPGSVAEGGLEDRAPVLLDVVRRVVEDWPQPPVPIDGRSFAELLRDAAARPRRIIGNRERLRSLLRWAGGIADHGDVRAVAPAERPVVGPLRGGSRRDVVADLLGSPILLHETATPERTRTRAGERVHVYLDVSGSILADVGVLMAAIRDCAAFVHPVIHAFSTTVVDHAPAELAAGRVRTTGGTDIRCVVDHARRHGIRRAVVVTDGYVGRPGAGDAATLERMRVGLACTVDPVPRDIAGHVGRTTILRVAA